MIILDGSREGASLADEVAVRACVRVGEMLVAAGHEVRTTDAAGRQVNPAESCLGCSLA